MRFLKMTALVCLILSLTCNAAFASGWDDCKAGEKALGRFQRDKAISLLSKCIKSGKLNKAQLKTAYENRGRAWRYKSQYDKAIADYTKAIKLDPKTVEAYLDRGMSWVSKEEYDKAIADYSKVIELSPKKYFVYIYRSLCYKRNRLYDKAIADCSKAIEIDPKRDTAYINRGLNYQKKTPIRQGHRGLQ